MNRQGKRPHDLKWLPYIREDRLMGTMVTQQVRGVHAESACKAVSDEIQRLEKLWSAFLPDSELNALSSLAGRCPATISPETVEILQIARDFHTRSEGAFDVTIAPLVKLWRDSAGSGFLPASRTIQKLLPLVDATLLRIEGNQAMLGTPGQSIDCGGIGKGYAADRARDVYRRLGIASACINLGGNVVVIGSKADGAPWRVGIQNPFGKRGACIGVIDAVDCSIVTSGSYERYWEIDNRRYHHILDPRTGMPAESDIAGVTVVTPSSAQGDGIATSVVVLGSKKGIELFRDLADILIVKTNGETVLTDGMRQRYRPLSEDAPALR